MAFSVWCRTAWCEGSRSNECAVRSGRDPRRSGSRGGRCADGDGASQVRAHPATSPLAECRSGSGAVAPPPCAFEKLAARADTRYSECERGFAWKNRSVARWNLTVSERTDRTVRGFLARTGGKKGDLSRFVDEAARRRVLDLSVREIKDRNARHDQQDLLDLIDEEVDAVRAGRS